MNERELRIEELFLEALERTPEERAEFVRARSEGDAELAEEVLDLLGHHDVLGDVLDRMPGALSTVATDGLDPVDPLTFDDPLGREVGPYEIERVLGRGGFGVVYLAQQRNPVRRSVALKVVKRGMDTDAVVRRFRSEQQALALLDHPGVAKVYDAGVTDDGRPYFAMEYVPGVPLTEYCDAARLSTEERLRLFLEVCAAVHHAHQKGILHRDLKPANILVRMREGRATPVVIDFGLAKAMHGSLLGDAQATRAGFFVGTPEFASPEQVRSDGLDVDTRADVYSLGVVLYHLLTGELPLEVDRSRPAYVELRRMVCEVDPPPPSRRIQSSERSTESARLRKTDPVSLTRRLRGDLDSIVLKALDKDRTRRYASASEFAADVERHLARLPVSAAPPSSLYRLRKFWQRNRVGVVVAGLLLGTLVAGLVGTTTGWRRALRAEREARRELDTAHAIQEHLDGVLSAASPWARTGDVALGRETRVVDVLALAADRVEDAYPDRPTIEAEVRSTIGFNFHQLGQVREAEDQLRRALEIQLRELGEDDERTVRTRARLSTVLTQANRLAEAERNARAVVAWYRAHDPDRIELLRQERELAQILQLEGRIDEAERDMNAVVERAHARLGPDDRDTLAAEFDLASLGYARGEREAPLERLASVHERLCAAFGEEDPDAIAAQTAYGGLLAATGRMEEAELALERALELSVQVHGERHPQTLTALNNLGEVKKRLGDVDGARPLLQRAVAIGTEVRGANHLNTLQARMNLALLLRQSGDAEAAERELRACWEVAWSELGPTNPETADYAQRLAYVLYGLQRFDEAEELMERAAEILDAGLGPRAPATLRARNDVAQLHLERGRPEEALEVLEAALADGRAALAPGDPVLLDTLELLRMVHAETGDADRAQAAVDEARAWAEAGAARNSPER